MNIHEYQAKLLLGEFDVPVARGGVAFTPKEAVTAAEDELADTGRIVLRASGTEPVIRVMVEGRDEQQVNSVAERLAAVVAEAAG